MANELKELEKIASIWQEGRRAMELQPVEQDSLAGQSLMTYFVLTAAWAGGKNLALQQLATTVPTECGPDYELRLRCRPLGEPLRGDPRFKKIVAPPNVRSASK